ncbi:hypothetical protein ACHAWF_010914 [Thalassiosira exigua]
MNSFVDLLFCRKHDDESYGDEICDRGAVGLSHVGEAIHTVLGKRHGRHHHSMWNVTRGKVIGSIDYTPKNVWDASDDPMSGNDDWLPEKLAEIISRTEAWCDIMSLGPPDGKFLTAFQTALQKLAERSKTSERPIVVRMLFGNIAGMPVNCNGVIKALTKGLPCDSKLQVWVGAWRKGFSWNHAKLIAVDGVYLHTGGHNLWCAHYLSNNPVHDLSMEMEGMIALDGHRFANQQWQFIETKQSTCIGCCVDAMPDSLPLALRTRVTVSEWPKGAVTVFPPQFKKTTVAGTQQLRAVNPAPHIPLISIGRQGTMVSKSRPSDDAITAMINSAKTIIRLVLQDLGPVCIPRTKKALPGLIWPKEYLSAIGEAIYERGVDIEMVLSNPNSIPGGLKGTEANYGNGWDCVDVAAEIIKAIQKLHADVEDARLRTMVKDNLRICFIRHDKSSNYEDGKTIGLHSKHFIVDDRCCYVGSQNLYMCDLAEWGVVIDNEVEVRKIMDDYFLPMWRNSYTGEDADVDKVMDGLDVDRDGEHTSMFHHQTTEEANMMPHGIGSEFYGIEKTNSDVTGDTDQSPESIPVVDKDEKERTEDGDSPTVRDDDGETAPEADPSLNPNSTAPSLAPTLTAPSDEESASFIQSASYGPSGNGTITTLATIDDESLDDTPKRDQVEDDQKSESDQCETSSAKKNIQFDCCGFTQSLLVASE